MSFTSEFETLLNEKKKNAQSKIGLFNAYSRELAAKPSTYEPSSKEIVHQILQGGALDDGYQFGDVAKIILGTAGEAVVDTAQGFMGFSEGIADWLGHNVVYPVARATGQTENDLKWYRKALNESTTQKVLGGVDAALDKHSVLGHTSDAVFQGVGQFIPMVAGGKMLQAAGVGATAANLGVKGMMGVSAMGSAQSEAYAGGATDGEALAYGAASAGSELLFESLFGGMGKALNMVGFSKGLSSLDDIAAKGISKFISSPAGKNVAQMLVKGGFEGLEEVGTGFAQAVAKKLTYMSEEEFGKILKDENLFEQFIVGALVSDIAQAGDVRTANKTGTDLVTGFTKNEQAVVDKEVENRIAQEEKGGKRLSGKEKSGIYEQVVRDMERGYISTETIESVLGKDALAQYDTLSKEAEEFKTLYETEGGKLSEKQKDRLAELKEKNKANPYEQLLKSQRAKIAKDVSALAQKDRLGESYAEQTRKGEKFQADVSKYNEAQRKTVQNAIDSGILNNTNRSHEFVDLVAKVSADKGISFDFADNAKLKESGFALDGVLVNGFLNENGVTINIQSAKALNRVVGHEITHVLEGTELYNALQSAVTEYAKTKKEYNRRLKELTKLYEGKNANVEQELVADLVGDYLFTDADFIKHLSTEHRNLFQKIYDEIKYLCKVVTAGTKEARQLEKVKKAFADAYRAETKNPTADGGAKHSIVALDNGNVYVKASRNIITGTTKADQRKNITDFFNDLLEGNSSLDIQTLEGDVLTITKAETANKARDDYKTVQGQSIKMTEAEFLVKLRAEAHVDELAEISHKNNRPPVPDGKNHAFAKNGFTYRRAYFEDFDGQYYEITLSIGHDGTVATVYNVGKISKGALPSAKIIAVVGSKALGKTPSTFSLSKTTENVKQKNNVYLDAVSRGDMQTAQQMVDEAAKAAGYDRRMFHETDAENIHVFDISRGDHGATDYETPYGIFTKTSDKNIGLGSRQIALYVKAQKTLYVEDRADVLNKIPGFVRYYDQIQEIDQRYNARAEELEDLEFEALGEWVQEHPEADMDEVYPTSYIIDHKPAKIDSLKYQEAFRQYEVNRQAWEKEYGEVAVKAKEFLTEYLRDNNYDSMYFRVDGGSRGRETDSLIVLNQNQVKSADPVTYDDKGNVISLSERFNTESKDIRYSLSKKDFSIAPPVGADVYGRDIAAHPDDWIPIRKDIPKKAANGQVYSFSDPRDPNFAPPTQQTIANVLDVEPKTAQQKRNRLWALTKANLFDKGAVFEDLSLQTKNRELMGKWNYILSSEARAQYLIGHGAEGVKSLNDIREQVIDSGKAKEFYEYLYHRLNADRMTLNTRYKDADGNPAKNKPVFGDTVTAEISRTAIEQYEEQFPEFKEFAQDVYDYMNHLRKLMIDSGMISQKTADLWAEMYPSYVPVRRAGKEGNAVNVSLYTGRAPIKSAKGGNSDILPLFDTMALRTIQTYKAIAKNNFGVELKNSLNSAQQITEETIDDATDGVDDQNSLLQAGTINKNPTFTVFENGQKVSFEITEDMYDALAPVSGLFAQTSKVLNKVSNFHRGLLTEYNPVFMLTNAIKDVQDVFINSQHPAKTYSKIPEAFSQICSKGYWYQEYMANGGAQNTYFDKQSKTFTEESKGIKVPLEKISRANGIVEATPRLAEYIASREAGRSVEVSMLDAARVTTNFAAGGDVTKFLNRNGATFLNASVQGLMQNVRNIREAHTKGLKGWAALAGKFVLAAVPGLLLNNLLWDDDEDYEELSDHVKQNYYVIAKYADGQFVRIPKGRVAAVIQDAAQQVVNATTGNDETDLENFVQLVINNLAPNNPVEDNILAPVLQAAANKTWYGGDLVPERLQDLPAAEQFDESTDKFSKWLGEKLNISPTKIHYLLDQYSGGVGDVVLPFLTPEAESGLPGISKVVAPVVDKFTSDSVMENQNVTDFYGLKDELTTKANSVHATDEDILRSKFVNSVSSDIGDLYKLKREIQNGDLSDSEKYARVREVQQDINTGTADALKNYTDVTIDGVYATVGHLRFRKNDEGIWKKLDEEQLARQDAVTSTLEIQPGEYWSRKEEYDYAYDYPSNYAVARAVGGYDAYKGYRKGLSNIKADKDQNGETIDGSRKKKVQAYINGLDAGYYEKLILWKCEYPSDDSNNKAIIQYLNSRDDLSRADVETILKKLGFKVSASGKITWD